MPLKADSVGGASPVADRMGVDDRLWDAVSMPWVSRKIETAAQFAFSPCDLLSSTRFQWHSRAMTSASPVWISATCRIEKRKARARSSAEPLTMIRSSTLPPVQHCVQLGTKVSSSAPTVRPFVTQRLPHRAAPPPKPCTFGHPRAATQAFRSSIGHLQRQLQRLDFEMRSSS